MHNRTEQLHRLVTEAMSHCATLDRGLDQGSLAWLGDRGLHTLRAVVDVFRQWCDDAWLDIECSFEGHLVYISHTTARHILDTIEDKASFTSDQYASLEYLIDGIVHHITKVAEIASSRY